MNIPRLLFTLLSIGIIGFFGCKNKDNVSTDPNARLSFSVDTLHFDTVFTTLSSITRNFKVYNRGTETVNISSIKLEGGSNSYYNININGVPQSEVKDQLLLANDSLYIFVEVTIDPTNQNSPLAVEDHIVFTTNGNEQEVLLLAYGQDAIIYWPTTYPTNGLPPYSIIGFNELDSTCSNTVWTNEKPILIFGYAVVDEGCSLTIEEGTQVYFHAFAGLWIFEDAQFSVLGTAENPVSFQGDRFEEIYEDEPGQWDRIWINKSSQDHIIQHATIRSALIGLQIESSPFDDTGGDISPNKITIENTFISYSSARGIYLRNYNAEITNVAISNSGQYSIAISGGGSFQFNNCTFSNYWTLSNRETACFTVVNQYSINNVIYERPITDSYLNNSIIDGNISDGNEFVLDLNGSGNSFNGSYNIIRTTGTLPSSFTNTYPYESPGLIDPWNANLKPSENAYALGKANPLTATESDLSGNPRPSEPALGAYEYDPD
jgi:hypothetical protein